MSLTRIQRDAMQRAQHGDWELADAIEVIARAESREHGELVGGTRQGGRLQFLVYASHSCCLSNCNEGECSCCDGTCEPDDDEVTVITNLNGDAIFDAESADSDGYPPPWWRGVDITPLAAREVVATYAAAVARPTQTNLIPESA